MRQSDDEAVLVQTAAECDDDAFAALCARHRRRLNRIIAHHISSPDDRDDLYAEIIARLYEHNKRALRAWKPVAPFIAYLTTIATRHCVRELKRKGRLQTTSLNAPQDSEETRELLDLLVVPDDSGGPDTALIREEIHRALAQTMARLSEIDRLILKLRFEDGLDSPAIGRVLGLTSGAVRQRIFKALRKLAVMLPKLYPELFDS